MRYLPATTSEMLVQHFLENSAHRVPDKTALICGNERWTYDQINLVANKLAAALVDQGAVRQDRIIIFMDSSVETVISLFAILKAGCIFIIVNSTIKAKKLGYIIRNSGARIIIAQDNKALIVKKAALDAVDLTKIIWCPGAKEKRNDGDEVRKRIKALTWNTMMNGNSPALPDSFCPGIDLDIATIIYTSGSTGEPKGVVSAHCNMVAAVRSICTYLENVEQDIILNALPLSFDYGLYQVLMTFSFGGTVVLERSFGYPYKVIDIIQKERITGFPIVPTMLAI
jgi:long-chain acyl-CoA synthetase